MSPFISRRTARSSKAAASSSRPVIVHHTPLAQATRHFSGAHRRTLTTLFGATASVYLLGSLFGVQAYANPAGGSVVAGNASIVQATPDTLNVVQSSNKAIVNWQSFSIGAGETVNFQQPSAKSVTLNRVTGNNPSAIFGSLNANGTVMLVNPNGVVFGAGSRVDVGGLVATTANINDADFMAGNYGFNQASANKDARIVNRGDISIRDAGLAALVAPGVENAGTIEARLGKVALGGAETFTLDFQGDGLLSFSANSVVTQAPGGNQGKALVVNSGRISADGGSIELSARAVQGVIDNVINTDGVITANSVGAKNGKIVLSGGDAAVSIAGEVTATGSGPAERGGSLAVTGRDVSVAAGTRIDVSGQAGGGQIALGSDGKDGAAWAKGSVTVAKGATLAADATTKGDGGKVTLLAEKNTRFEGSISAKGGAQGGDGGFSEVSSRDTIVLAGDVDLSAAKGKTGELLIDPATLNITDASAASNSGNQVSRGWLEGQAANANITLEADGLITIEKMASNLIDLKTTSGNSFTLRSLKSDGIVFADAATEIRTRGGAITLEALGVGSTLSNIGKLTTAGGDISLVSNSGITLGNALAAGSGNATVQTIAGSIASLSDSASISGSRVSLLAATGNLGTASSALRTSTSALTLQTGGHFNVINDGSLNSLSITSRHILPTASNTYALSSNGLDFAMADGSEYDLQRVTQNGLDFTFSGDRSMRLGRLDLGSGALALTSSTGSLLAGADNQLRAASLTFNAAGQIGSTTAALNTASPLIQASALNGGLYLNNQGALNLTALATGNVAVTTSGALTLNGLTATNRSVTLTANGGDILSRNGLILDAGALILNASGALGSQSNRLLSNATSLSGSSGSGGIYATLSGSSATLNLLSTDGAIDLKTSGTTTATRLQSLNTSGDSTHGVRLEVASGNLFLGDIGSGSVADVLLRLLGSGMVNSLSGTRVSGRRVTLDSSLTEGGNVNINTAAAQLDVQSRGAVAVDQLGSVRVERLVSGASSASLVNQSGDTTLVSVSATGQITLTSRDGSILDDGDSTTAIVTSGASQVSLNASRHLGEATARLSSKAQSLSLTSGGDIYLNNDANLSALLIDNRHAEAGRANVLQVSSPYQGFAISNDGSRYLLSNVDSALLNTFSFTGDQSLVIGQVRGSTASAITLRATAGDILDDGNAQSRITGARVSLSAAAGSLGNAAQALNLNSADLTLNSAGNVYLDNLADLASLNLTSRHADPAARYTYRLTAPSLVLDLSDAAEGYRFNTLTDISGLSFTFNGDRDLRLGDINLTRSGNLNLTSSNGSIFDDGDSATRVLASNVSLTARGGVIGSNATPLTLVAQSINAYAYAGGVDLVLAMPTNSTFNQTSLSAYAYAGDVNVNALQGDLQLATIYATGDVRLNSANGSMSYGSGTVSGANLTLAAKGALGSAGQELQLNSNGPVTAVAQAGDIALYNLSSSFKLGNIDAGTANLYLRGNGSLVDDGDSGTRLRGAAITLNANGTLGTADTALLLATGKLTASANGRMNLVNQNSLSDLSLTGKGSAATVSLVDGNIGSFAVDNAGGAYYLQNISALGALNFSFTGNASNIRVGHIDTAGGSASLSSAGSISADGGTGTHIAANTVALKAGGSIGASGDNNTLLLSGTRNLSLEAAGNFYVSADRALNSLALTVNNTGNSSNLFAIAASGQTYTLSDDGAGTHRLVDISGSGLNTFSFTGNKNIAVGSIIANTAVSLKTSAGASNTISQIGTSGTAITANSVSLHAQRSSNDLAHGYIGVADNFLRLDTSALSLYTTGNLYLANSRALNTLGMTLRHSSTAADAPVYTYRLTSNGLSLNVGDSNTLTSINTLTQSGLNFSLDSDRGIAVGTLNTGSRTSGSVTLSSSAGYNTSTGLRAGISGGTITSGAVSLSAASYMGYLNTSTNTDRLALSSAGDVSVSNSGNLSSLSLTANVNNNSNAAAYNISANNISQNSISYDPSLFGLRLNNVVASNLALTVNTGHTLTVNSVNTGTAGSATLTTTGTLQGQASNAQISAGSVTLNARSVGVYASLAPLLLSTSQLAGTVSGYLNVANSGAGNLTLGNLALGSGRITNDASILYGDASIKATSLVLQATNGSIGSAAKHLRLDVRDLSLSSDNDMYVDGTTDFYSLNVTNTHAQANRQNVLQVTAPQLLFDIVDNGSRYVLSQVSDASGVDFSFYADKDIQVSTVDAQRGRSISLSTAGNLISQGADLNGDVVRLAASGAIGTGAAVFDSHALSLDLSAGRDIYVANSLDLSALSLYNTQAGNIGASYSITSGPAFGSATPTLTLVASDDGANTLIDRLSDSTGINFTARTAQHNLLYGNLNTSPDAVSNGGQLSLISSKAIAAKDGSSYLTAAKLSFLTYDAAGIGASGSALKFSAPLLDLNVTGSYFLAADVHLDELAINTQRQAGGSVATYQLAATGLSYAASDASGGTTLNISDSQGLRLTYSSGRSLVLGEMDLGRTSSLGLSVLNSGAAISGDGDATHGITTGTLNLYSQSGSIGTSNAVVRADAANVTANAQGGGVRVSLSNPSALSGVTARGDSYLDNSVGDIALGSINLNGNKLFVTNTGGSILSGSLQNVTEVTLDAYGSIGYVSAITTSALNNGTTTLTATARSNARGATGSIALNESFNLIANTVVAPGGVTLNAGRALTVGTVNATDAAVALTASRGNLAGLSGNRVTGASVRLSADYVSPGETYSIGSSGTPINLTTANLDLVSAQNIYVNNNRTLDSLSITRNRSQYATGGSISVTSSGLVANLSDSAISNLSGNGLDFTFNANQALSIGTINVGNTGNVVLSSQGYQRDGSITALDGNSLITAGSLSLSASNAYLSNAYTPGSIGSAGQALRTSVSNISATAPGVINLDNQGSVRLDNLSAGGNISVVTRNGGDIFLGALAYGNGSSLSLNANGSILAGTATLSSTAGAIVLEAVNGIGSADAAVKVSSGVNPVTAKVSGSGDIHLETSNMSGGLRTLSNGGDTFIKANGNLLLSQATSQGGNIRVDASGNLTTDQLDAGSGNIALNGVSILALNGSSAIRGQGIDIVSSGLGGIGNSSQGLNTIGRNVTVSSAGGNIYLSPSEASTLAVVASNGGAIVVRAGSDLLLGSLLSSGGLIDASTTGNLYVGNVNAGGGNVKLSGGAIKADDGQTSLIIGSAVDLRAVSAIGDVARALQTRTGNLSALVSGNGDLYLVDSNAAGLRLESVRTQNGLIDIRAAGPLQAASVVSSSDAAGNDIRLQNALGDLLLGSLSAGQTLGSVNLISAGNVARLGNDVQNVSAHSLSINAAGNIGSVTDVMTGTVDALRTRIGVLTLADAASQVAITNSSALSIGANAVQIATDGKLYLSSTGDLDATQLLAPVNGDMALLSSGVLRLPQSALTTSGNLRVEGAVDILRDGLTPRSIALNAGALRFVSGSQGGLTTLDSQSANLYVRSNANDLVVVNQGQLSTLSVLGTGNIDFTNDLGFVANAISTSGSGKTLNLTAQQGDITLVGALTGHALTATIKANDGNVDLQQAASGLTALSIEANAISLVGVTSNGAQQYSGNTSLRGNYLTTGGTFTVNGATHLLGATNILSGNGTVVLGTVDGNQALSIANGSGSVRFDGSVGASEALASLDVSGTGRLLLAGDILTSGAQQYRNVQLAGNSTLTSQQAGVSFAGLVDGAHDLLVISNDAGDVNFLGAIGSLARTGAIRVQTAGDSNFASSVRAASVYTDDPGSVRLAANVDTTGNQYYGERLNLAADILLSGAQVTLAAGANGAQALSIIGNAVLGGPVGEDQALSSLSISGAALLQGGSISTRGSQTYLGAVTLASDTRLNTSGGNVTFASSLDGSHDLNIASATGDVRFNGVVGGLQRLGAMQIDSDGTSHFGTALKAATLQTSAGGVLEIVGGPIDTLGTQRYGEHLTLSTDTVLKASEVILLAGVDARPGASQSLLIDGNATLANVGATTALSTLSITGTGNIKGGVTTTGAQHYTETLIIDADTVLKASSVTLAKGVGGVAAGEQSLRIEGDAVISGEQGAIAPLASLTVVGSTRFNGGSLVTTGDQRYQGAVTLDGNQSLNSTRGSLSFGASLDSGNRSSLTLSAGQQIRVDGAVGGQSALGTLTLDAGDSIAFASNVRVGSVQQAAAGGLTRFSGDLLADGADGIVLSGKGFVFEGTVTAEQGGLAVHNSDDRGSIIFKAAIRAMRDFKQTGGAEVYLPDSITIGNGGIELQSVAKILSAKATFSTSDDIVMTGLLAPTTWLTLSSGSGALNIGKPGGNAQNGNLLQVGRLTVPTAGSARLYGSIAGVGGRQVARDIDSALKRAPYFINDTPWGGDESIAQLIASTVPHSAIPTTPQASPLFTQRMDPRGLTPEPLGVYMSPEVLSTARFAAGCTTDTTSGALRCQL